MAVFELRVVIGPPAQFEPFVKTKLDDFYRFDLMNGHLVAGWLFRVDRSQEADLRDRIEPYKKVLQMVPVKREEIASKYGAEAEIWAETPNVSGPSAWA